MFADGDENDPKNPNPAPGTPTPNAPTPEDPKKKDSNLNPPQQNAKPLPEPEKPKEEKKTEPKQKEDKVANKENIKSAPSAQKTEAPQEAKGATPPAAQPQQSGATRDVKDKSKSRSFFKTALIGLAAMVIGFAVAGPVGAAIALGVVAGIAGRDMYKDYKRNKAAKAALGENLSPKENPEKAKEQEKVKSKQVEQEKTKTKSQETSKNQTIEQQKTVDKQKNSKIDKAVNSFVEKFRKATKSVSKFQQKIAAKVTPNKSKNKTNVQGR